MFQINYEFQENKEKIKTQTKFSSKVYFDNKIRIAQAKNRAKTKKELIVSLKSRNKHDQLICFILFYVFFFKYENILYNYLK